MKKYIVLMVAIFTLLLVGCSDKKDDFENNYTIINGTKTFIKDADISDNIFKVSIDWQIGNKSDSIKKTTFVDSGVEIKAYQNGVELLLDPKNSSNLYQKNYDGERSNVIYSFALISDDIIELTTDIKNNNVDVGTFYEKDSKKINEEEEYFAYYKRFLNNNLNSFVSLSESLSNVSILDVKFSGDEMFKYANETKKANFKDYKDDEFETLVNKLADSYIELSIVSNSINYYDKKSVDDNKNEYVEAVGNTMKIQKEIADTYYDGELPPSIKDFKK